MALNFVLNLLLMEKASYLSMTNIFRENPFLPGDHSTNCKKEVENYFRISVTIPLLEELIEKMKEC